MSVREYLRERAAESRHDELSSYLMFIAGGILFVGGVLITLFVADSVSWFFLVPVGLSEQPGCLLGTSLTLSGSALAIFGLVAGIYFTRSRAWYIHELSSVDLADERVVEREEQKEKEPQ